MKRVVNSTCTTKRRSRGWLRQQRTSSGFSLLEVVMAMVVVGMILVPTASMMTRALQGESTRTLRSEMLLLASGKQAQFSHLARVNFQNRNESGDFASTGHDDIRFTVNCSDSAAQGGLPGLLQAIRVVAWVDEDRDQSLDDSEPRVDLWTCVSRAAP